MGSRVRHLVKRQRGQGAGPIEGARGVNIAIWDLLVGLLLFAGGSPHNVLLVMVVANFETSVQSNGR
jgi:hypothetical protein